MYILESEYSVCEENKRAFVAESKKTDQMNNRTRTRARNIYTGVTAIGQCDGSNEKTRCGFDTF